MINRAALDKIDSYTEIGEDEGAKLLTGGEIATENGLDKGFFYRPTVFGDVDPEMRIAQEEIFGPTTALIRSTTSRRRSAAANWVEYGLSSSIFTRDVNKAFRAMRDLNTGITYINAGTTGAEVHLPFGGTKATGNGHREAGQAALDVFTEWKSIYVDYSGKLQRAQIDKFESPARRLWRAPLNRKLVVFVPRESLDTVRDALFAAGGRPDRRLRALLVVHAGTGTFRGGEGTSPSIGESGREERVAELRLETVYPGGAPRRRRRRASSGASVRGAGLRRLSAPVKARLFTDGGARGNPGPAAYAYVLEAEDGTVLDARGEAIGVATNNVAEYRGLVAGLAKAVELGGGRLEVVSDSELIVKQMRGEYKIKNEALRDLSLEAASAMRAQIGTVRYTAVRREHNELADRLVNDALDAGSQAAILRRLADVAQLARASACHAEGRGFESHHPLSKPAGNGGFSLSQAQFAPCVRPEESASSHSHGSRCRRARGTYRMFSRACCAGESPTSGYGRIFRTSG